MRIINLDTIHSISQVALTLQTWGVTLHFFSGAPMDSLVALVSLLITSLLILFSFSLL